MKRETSSPTLPFVSSLALPALLLTLLVPACGGGSSGSDGGSSGGKTTLQDQNNYTAEASLTIPQVNVKEGTDLDICWDMATQDLQCHSFSSSYQIDNVSFLKITRGPESSIATQFADGNFDTNNVKTYADLHVDHSSSSKCTKLSSLTKKLTGSGMVDPSQDLVSGSNTYYMIVFSKGTTIGVGAVTMLFLEPSSSESNTSIAAANGCGILDFTAHLDKPTVSIPAKGPFVVDFSKLTKDALGNSFAFSVVDTLMVGFYENKSVQDLQNNFFDLETDATTLYQGSIDSGAQTVDLTTAKDSNGNKFSGFDKTDGTWMMALLGSLNQSPAPMALVILNPTN